MAVILAQCPFPAELPWDPAGHTWTLAVEEHFQLLLPFALVTLAAAGRTRLLVRLCVIVVPAFLALRCLSVWTADPFSVNMSATHLRLDALLFGVGIRGLAQYSPDRFAALRRWRLALVAMGVLLWAPNLFPGLDSSIVRTVGLTGTFLGGGAFLVAAYHTHASDFGRWSRVIAPLARLVAWFGVYSYAIYLWHVTVMGILEREIGERLLAQADHSSPAVWLACAAAVSAGAIIAGVVASKAVEQPVLLLRDRLFPSRSQPIPATPASSGGGSIGATVSENPGHSPRSGASFRDNASCRQSALVKGNIAGN